MFLNVVAVQNISGKSKKDGSSFSMNRLVALTEFEPVNGEKFSRSGNGFIISEIEVSNAFYPKLLAVFGSIFKDKPVPMEFKTTIGGGGRSTVICDFSDSFKTQITASAVKAA